MSNSLATVHPELIVEWSDRNLPLTPDSVTFGSNKKVWWKGACGHEWWQCRYGHSWSMKINERTVLGKECRMPKEAVTHLTAMDNH